MEATIIHFFSDYAYHPLWIYSGIFFFMILSAFGLPLPEEVVLISSGLVGYAALHPEQFPPPYPGAPVVNVYVLAAASFVSVVFSDYLIYFLGQKFGRRILKGRFFSRMINPRRLVKIEEWVKSYGYFACVIFRFTPGIRFPGHLMCGAMGLNTLGYLAIDSIAALVSAPTQVLLAAFYGNEILSYIKEFKLWAIATGLLVISVIYLRRYRERRKSQRRTTSVEVIL